MEIQAVVVLLCAIFVLWFIINVVVESLHEELGENLESLTNASFTLTINVVHDNFPSTLIE